jgi:hypothetical protein
MTVNSPANATLRIRISTRDRQAILDNVLAALQKRFYSPEKLMETGKLPSNVSAR